jgi:hypothetical protein
MSEQADAFICIGIFIVCLVAVLIVPILIGDRMHERRIVRMRIDARLAKPTAWLEMDAINAKLLNTYSWREFSEGKP